MYLTRLQLTDFRSYRIVDVTLRPGVTIFSGPNGEGKTNLVEAVGYVATLASHRAAHDVPLIRQGAQQAIIRASVHDATRDNLAEIEINPGRANRVRLNRTPLSRPREILGVLRTVMFAPEDLALVKGDPGERRRFLDDLLVAMAPRYAGIRADYERVLKQRTALLKSAGPRVSRSGVSRSGVSRDSVSPDSVSRDRVSRDRVSRDRVSRDDAARKGAMSSARDGNGSRETVLATLDVWDAQLARAGAELLVAREHLVDALRPHVERAYAAVAGDAFAGNAAARNAAAGSAVAGSAVAGSAVAGEAVAGRAAVGNPAAGGTGIGSTRAGDGAGDTAAGNTAAGDAVAGDTAAGGTGAGDAAASGAAAGSSVAGGSATGGSATGGTATGSTTAGSTAAGNTAAGNSGDGNTVSTNSDLAGISYRRSFGGEGEAPVRSGYKERVVDAEASLRAALAEVRASELDRGVCLAGPHRDELELSVRGLPARGYASHGESWSLALALRLASFELLRAGRDDPVLILDDVFAELDTGRRDRLASLVAGAEQVLVTAAVPDDVPAVLAGDRYLMSGGALVRAGSCENRDAG